MSDSPPLRVREKGTRKDVSYPHPPEPLPFPVYDNHTHLEISDGDSPLTVAKQLDAAEDVGVRGIIQIGGDLESSEWSAALASQDQRVLAGVAIHPNEVPMYAQAGKLEEAIDAISEWAKQPRVVVVGETGLDFFRTPPEEHHYQFTSFEAHIEIAKTRGCALQIHDRDAHDEVVSTLLRVGAPARTVFHCFSGDENLAKICRDQGWFVSLSGTFTFANAHNLRRALTTIPLESVLVETDAPFLTPVPHRGKANAPYLLPYTVRSIAHFLGRDLDEVCQILAENTERVYGKWDTHPVSLGDTFSGEETTHVASR